MTNKICSPTHTPPLQSLRGPPQGLKDKVTKAQMLCPVPPELPAHPLPSSVSHMEHGDLKYTLLDWPESPLMVEHKL